MNILDLLKKAGYRTYIKHSRYYPGVPSPLARKEAEKDGFPLSQSESRGGYTEVEIYKGDRRMSYGWAQCSVHDNFCKKVGRQYALQRALEDLKDESSS